MSKFGSAPSYLFNRCGKWWQARIGLEIHAQVNSKTKLFSGAPHFSGDKNSRLALFDIAIPGTLPRLNDAVVKKALTAALGLNCKINKISHFDRKHYFYQDLPLGYQITQQSRPIAQDGVLQFQHIDENVEPVSGRVGVKRIQIEQDSARSIHDMHEDFTLIDFNRAGTALIEIVFEPSIRTPRQAASVLETIQGLLRHLNVSNGNLEDGSLRCDVNISVTRCSNEGAEIEANERVEIKNLSSLHRYIYIAKFRR
jgi:aspartyl-tRNA(Asn)/glutamyl-tRNA(Gln) amidotransferase subunit B